MMRYFCAELNHARIRDNLEKISMARMGKILENIPTKDLYYLKRVCEDSAMKIFSLALICFLAAGVAAAGESPVVAADAKLEKLTAECKFTEGTA